MASANVPRPIRQVVVENVATFRRNQTPNEICVVPEIPQNRKNTDVAFTITFGICLVVLISLMIYAIVNSDIQRFTHGYDKCGNVCGSTNSDIVGINSCSGQDMTDKPFLTYKYDSYYGGYTPDSCVKQCDYRYTERLHRCFPSDNTADIEFWPYVIDTIQEDSVGLTVLCLVGLGLSIVTLVLFRYFPKQFVWSMLILVVLLMFGITGFFWWGYSVSKDQEGSNSFLFPAILFTIISIIVALCILFLTSRIKLIIFFFQEAIRIVFAMPLILLEPVLTFISKFIVMGIFVYTFVLMASSGTLGSDGYGRYVYNYNGAMTFTLVWSVIMTIWMLLFILACQQIVISGAIATYYFAKDKLVVISPIYNSFYNLVRFHLGTAAFGSLTITILTILKICIRGLANQNGWLRILYICFRPIEDLVKYMTSMGYIETAIHGQPLCRSSFRALNLIIANLLSAVALNSIANFVFFMAKAVVVTIVILIGVLMGLSAWPIVLGAVVAFMCAHCFFVVFEIAVDTIFICYCEDQCINDGDVNPYYASVELHNEIKKAQILSLAQENKKDKSKK